ncbi:MAG: TIGR03435 family protein [Verrucomicrobiia bacterium]
MSEPDHQLIAEFNARRSEEAFAALVRQHVNLVFATALRQVGDAGAAEEITQNVFVALALAAGKLGSHPTIAGWLHQTALNKSREWLRSELRRRRREQVAVNLDLARAEGDSVWSPLVPLLDEALLELREPDRLAVILHFMEGQTFHEVGSALGIGEDTARKRVNRCLGQLTHFFRRRGFATPALLAGSPLFTLSSHAAPAGLAASATTAGLAAAHSAATLTLTLIKGALKIMAWTKAKTAIVVGASVLLAAGTTTVTVKAIHDHWKYSWEVPHPNNQVLEQAPPQVTILPAKFLKSGGGGWAAQDGRVLGISAGIVDMLQAAYATQARMVFKTELPQDRYDFIANLPTGTAQALQTEIKRRFGLVGRFETIETNVLVLTVKYPNAQGLKPSRTVGRSNRNPQFGEYSCINQPISGLTYFLELYLGTPIIDRTGLKGGFDMDVKWNDADKANRNVDGLKQALTDQLGLELVPGREPIEMLVVEKAK